MHNLSFCDIVAVDSANRSLRNTSCTSNRSASVLSSPLSTSRRSSEDSLEENFNYRDIKVSIVYST